MQFSGCALVLVVAGCFSGVYWNGAEGFSSSNIRPSFLSKLSTGQRSVADVALGMSTVEAAPPETGEQFEFQAEVGRVMEIIINSLYSDKDVFLRELISNAADACDKKRFLSLTEEGGTAQDLAIKIKSDSADQTIVIEDTGVGMTRDELINNLGRIAKSGTKSFIEALGSGNADVNLIGQFGVGFYSAYLVADRVEVITKSMQPGSKQLRWTSDASSTFSISEDSSDPIETSGTRLILHVKDDCLEYLQSDQLEDLVQRYSQFIEFPISVWKQTTEYKQVPDVEANAELAEGEEPKMKTVPETTSGFELMNNQKPIWLRPPKEVTESEYQEFYKSTFRNTYEEPTKYTHFRLEGQVECRALLYIPSMLPFELSKDMFDENTRNLRLYVKRVFINDNFEELMPRWLKFVKGIVDSDDLPLNVGREILQKSKVLSIINKRLVRKSIDMIKELSEEKDEESDDAEGEEKKEDDEVPRDNGKYVNFWNNFGKYLKVGVIEDDKNKDELVPFLRFYSSKSGDEFTSFDRYVAGMAEGQKAIYYVSGDSREKAAMSPSIEKLTSRGYEVMYMVDPLDEITIEAVKKYKDFDVVDATKEGLKLDDAEENKEEADKKQEELNEEFKDVRDYLETMLDGKVRKVVVSDLLTASPAALVQGAYGMSPTMQRYMRNQAVATGGDPMMGGGMNQAVLEINPKHSIVQDLERMVKAGQQENEETKNYAMLLYDVASMLSGYEVEDVKDFGQRVMSLMTNRPADSSSGGVQDAEIM